MNDIRKIAIWIWLKKERMVLGVMVLVLCWRVYVVAYPQETNEVQVAVLPPSSEPAAAAQRPENPPAPPPLPGPADWSALWQRNPFTVYSEVGRQGGGQSGDTAAPIRLLNIQVQADGSARAQIYTNTAKWYREGAQFESYRLTSINVDQKTCDVYSEKEGKDVTLVLQK